MGFLLTVCGVLFILWLVFKIAFTAIKFAFKFTFWIFELAFVIVGGAVFSGSILAFLTLMLAANILFLPVMALLCRR